MNVTPQQRALTILEQSEALLTTDPSLFLKVARDLSAKAERISEDMLGENHPLAEMLNTEFNAPGFDALMSGVEEYRRRQDEL